MGKNLKGKECGKGICQGKDGKYAARYTAKNGSRREKHFDTLPEARNWLADAQYEDKHDVNNPQLLLLGKVAQFLNFSFDKNKYLQKFF